MSRRAPTGRPAKEMGWVYTLHLLPPYPADAAPAQQQAKHYTGWTRDLAQRVADHANGNRAAGRLMQVQHQADGTFILVSVEPGTRDRETQLKERGAPPLRDLHGHARNGGGAVSGKHASGRSVRRVVARVCIAVSFTALVAAVAVPRLRHHALAGGLGIVAAATVSIVCGLAYLRSSRRRP